MNLNFKEYLLKVTDSTDCKEVEVIQSLWSGYGKILRYRLSGSKYETVVVKSISPNQSDTHPRGWGTDFSHKRKVKSYEVEANWYKQWSQDCNEKCRLPKFIGSHVSGDECWIIMEDLDNEFPVRKEELSIVEMKNCLNWLANFHATFLNTKPNNLWEIGTYWHLATRPDEFEKIEHKELKAKAHLIDKALNECKYQTIVHGDAKLANFCFSEEGGIVAAVDFQYTGGGCGMKDVAYFLGSCYLGVESALHEQELLDYYFAVLRKLIEPTGINFQELENEWRRMYPFACADFTRFLLGWMPTHQKVNKYQLGLLESVLAALEV